MLFARHELWAVETAMRFPFFALFIHATLWVWGLLAVPVLIVLLLVLGGSVIGAAIMTAITLPFLLAFFLWFSRWYFLCVGLVCGRRRMAENKLRQVRLRLGLSDA